MHAMNTTGSLASGHRDDEKTEIANGYNLCGIPERLRTCL